MCHRFGVVRVDLFPFQGDRVDVSPCWVIVLGMTGWVCHRLGVVRVDVSRKIPTSLDTPPWKHEAGRRD
jgi:hypothetical protein